MHDGWYPQGAKTHFDAGIELKKKNDFDGAIKEFSETIRLCAWYFEAYGELGDVYAVKGMIDDAVAMYKNALNHCPQDRKIAVAYILADFLYNQKRLKEALEYYEYILQDIDPLELEMKPLLVEAYKRTRKIKNEPIFDADATGETIETAVKMYTVPNSGIGISAETDYISLKFGTRGKDWKTVKQELIFSEDKSRAYDKICIKLADGSEKVIYFDITEWYGKHSFPIEDLDFEDLEKLSDELKTLIKAIQNHHIHDDFLNGYFNSACGDPSVP